MENSRSHLYQLCQSFALLFQKLKDNRLHKFELESSNQDSLQVLENEKDKRMKTENLLAHEKDDLTKQLRQVQDILESFESSEQQLDEAISLSLNQQDILMAEKQDLEDNLSDHERAINERLQKQSFQTEEVNFLCKQLDMLNAQKKQIAGEVEATQATLEANAAKISDVVSKLSTQDEQTSALVHERDQAEYELKNSQKELAATIKANAAVLQKLKEAQKTLERLSTHLDSKIKRLDTQYKYNGQLNMQIKKLESLRNSQKQRTEGEAVTSPVGSRSIRKSLSPSRVNSGSNLESGMSGSTVNSGNNGLNEDQKNRMRDYKQQLIMQLEYYKAEIENYDQSISSVETDIESLKSKFEQYTYIPQEKLKALFEQNFLSNGVAHQQNLTAGPISVNSNESAV